MLNDKDIYKILFHNQNKVYEIHAHAVKQSMMLGFIEVEGLIFGERSSLLVDPAEEKLHAEFTNVERSFIPINAVIRIDKVSRAGQNKIMPGSDTTNVTPFTGAAFTPPTKND